ncbi:hypothetical protein C8R43DRAFT_1088393 [Mycena crocata]|nr:hypothetical protein C8R43DRAFT_1088393 [Mycena crocata]
MRYAVKFGKEHSLPFHSLIGLFTGDTASPTLWNIFFADFRLPPHKDDVHLNGRPVSQAEQADDNLIMSTSFTAFQDKVNAFYRWCTNKRVFISAKKSKWMIFGPLPAVLPVLRIGDLVVELVHEFKYVGIWFTSVHADVFAKHYQVKASKARNTSNAIFGLNHRIGSLPVREGLQLYMARVDCYPHLGEHLEAQHMFLRRLLGLNPHSMLAVLFTETGQMPVRIRRLLLALGRLRYMVKIDDKRRVVRDALLDSMALLREGQPGWASDVTIMLRRLPTPIEVTADDLLCTDSIEAIEKRVIAVADADLQHDIDRLVKTHLIRNRVELDSSDKSLRLVTRRLRHYLHMVAVPAHRKAITGLLLGDHNLSVERLHYPARYRAKVPREFRLCRLCRGAVEDETHALLDCNTEERLVMLRSDFLDGISSRDPTLLALLIASRKLIQWVAKYVFNVLALYQESPRFFPVAFRIPAS